VSGQRWLTAIGRARVTFGLGAALATGLRTTAGLATAAAQALVSASVASTEQATTLFLFTLFTLFTLSNLRHWRASPGGFARSR
jgi:hypothetical protein